MREGLSGLRPTALCLPAREYLADDAADWKGNLLNSSAPRPITQPPAIVRTGYDGIPDNDLVRISELRYASGCHLSETELRDSAENWVCDAIAGGMSSHRWRAW